MSPKFFANFKAPLPLAAGAITKANRFEYTVSLAYSPITFGRQPLSIAKAPVRNTSLSLLSSNACEPILRISGRASNISSLYVGVSIR